MHSESNSGAAVRIATAANSCTTKTAFTPNPERQYVRPKEAALIIGTSVPTLYRWRTERPDFPKPLKLGPRTTVYSRAALLDFLSQRPVAGQGAA
jgi:predicted DNA-binding transcriptional regulator AlpA